MQSNNNNSNIIVEPSFYLHCLCNVYNIDVIIKFNVQNEVIKEIFYAQEPQKCTQYQQFLKAIRIKGHNVSVKVLFHKILFYFFSEDIYLLLLTQWKMNFLRNKFIYCDVNYRIKYSKFMFMKLVFRVDFIFLTVFH